MAHYEAYTERSKKVQRFLCRVMLIFALFQAFPTDVFLAPLDPSNSSQETEVNIDDRDDESGKLSGVLVGALVLLGAGAIYIMFTRHSKNPHSITKKNQNAYEPEETDEVAEHREKVHQLIWAYRKLCENEVPDEGSGRDNFFKELLSPADRKSFENIAKKIEGPLAIFQNTHGYKNDDVEMVVEKLTMGEIEQFIGFVNTMAAKLEEQAKAKRKAQKAEKKQLKQELVQLQQQSEQLKQKLSQDKQRLEQLKQESVQGKQKLEQLKQKLAQEQQKLSQNKQKLAETREDVEEMEEAMKKAKAMSERLQAAQATGGTQLQITEDEALEFLHQLNIMKKFLIKYADFNDASQ